MRQEKLQPFHKSILNHLANANESEMRIFANLIHDTAIPPSSYGEILRMWKRRCLEIKCPDYGITARLSASN